MIFPRPSSVILPPGDFNFNAEFRSGDYRPFLYVRFIETLCEKYMEIPETISKRRSSVCIYFRIVLIRKIILFLFLIRNHTNNNKNYCPSSNPCSRLAKVQPISDHSN